MLQINTDNTAEGAASIEFDRVDISFQVYSARGRSLKRSLLNVTTGGRIGLDHGDRVVVEALRGVSFVAGHGQRVGLIGHNGAGKSTMLRAIAGVYEPIRGSIRVTGRVASLIDLTLGMDLEASGHENIRIRSLLLGVPRNQITAHVDEIAEVTELGEFLRMPIRTYSSGMLLRLAFAISTSFVPDILLMDEWISVGDASFVGKAQVRLKKLVGQTGVLVIASHSESMIRDTCTRAIWLEKGEVHGDGDPADVFRDYAKWTARSNGAS